MIQTLQDSCLVIIDMQRFFTKSSNAFNMNLFYKKRINDIIRNCERLNELFSKNQKPIIFTKQIIDEDSLLFLKHKQRLRALKDPKWNKLILNTKNSIIIEKYTHDAFYRTNLEDILNYHKVKTLIFCGIYTNICVESTLRSGFNRNFYPILIHDATLSYNNAVMNNTFDVVKTYFRDVISSNELIKDF